MIYSDSSDKEFYLSARRTTGTVSCISHHIFIRDEAPIARIDVSTLMASSAAG